MFTDLQTRRVLRRTALAGLLLLTGAPIALADPPGYDFMVFEQSLPAKIQEAAPAAPQAQVAADNQRTDQASPTAHEPHQQTTEATQTAR